MMIGSVVRIIGITSAFMLALAIGCAPEESIDLMPAKYKVGMIVYHKLGNKGLIISGNRYRHSVEYHVKTSTQKVEHWDQIEIERAEIEK